MVSMAASRKPASFAINIRVTDFPIKLLFTEGLPKIKFAARCRINFIGFVPWHTATINLYIFGPTQPRQPNSRGQGKGMARRAPDGSVKSPVNIVVGILLKRLRERSDKQLDQVAPAFNVSPGYLAAIEAGTNAVSAKSVAGRRSLGVDFVAASALLTLVS